MDKQKIKSVPRLTTDNPVDNFQTALNFTDVSEDGWVWLRQPEMALTEYARQLVKGHGSSIDLGCNDMELSESLTDHLFDDPKQSIDGLIAEHYTILWAYATLREKLKWYEDAGIPVIPNYGLSTIRRAINRYGTAPQLQMAIKEMSELTKAICNLQRAVTFNYRNGAKIKVAHESVREEIADVYIMLAQLVEIVGKPEEVQQIVLEKLEQLKGDLDGGEVQSEKSCFTEHPAKLVQDDLGRNEGSRGAQDSPDTGNTVQGVHLLHRSRWLGYEVAQGWRAENGQQSDRRVHLRQNRQARPRRNDDGHKHFDIGRVV